MDLDTLMSHITYIISLLSLLINCVCCQRLCSKNKDSGKCAELCDTSVEEQACHVPAASAVESHQAVPCHHYLLQNLSSKKGVWHVCLTLQRHICHMAKAAASPFSCFGSAFYTWDFYSFSHMVLINGRKSFPFYTPASIRFQKLVSDLSPCMYMHFWLFTQSLAFASHHAKLALLRTEFL